MLRAIVFTYFFLSYCFTCSAQHKTTVAVKVSTAPRIDGLLDENIWIEAYSATCCITNTPSFGNPSTDTTSVKILYDNTAIYIGAILYSDPALIRKQFTPRDQERQADADHFAVFIDSYKDRQNAF